MLTPLLVIAAAMLALLGLRVGLALAQLRRLPSSPESPLPAGTLTVAQAVLSGDPGLEARLAENLAELNGQRVLWLIDTDDAEARRVTEALRNAFPAVDARVVECPPCPAGANPKVWKLERAAALAQTPFLAVVDDDTVLPAASAAALVAAARTHTVATGLPGYLDARDTPSALLAQFVNNQAACTYLGTSRLLPPFTLNGMGYVLQLRELERVGGFASIRGELTDDLALAARVLRTGGTIHQSAAPLRVRTGVRGFGHFAALMHRWFVFSLVLLHRQPLPARGLIVLLHGLPPVLLLTLVVLAALEPTPVALAVTSGVLVARGAALTALLRRVGGAGRHRPLLSVVSELLQPFHLLHALVRRTIRWRTRRYRVHADGGFSPA